MLVTEGAELAQFRQAWFSLYSGDSRFIPVEMAQSYQEILIIYPFWGSGIAAPSEGLHIHGDAWKIWINHPKITPESEDTEFLLRFPEFLLGFPKFLLGFPEFLVENEHSQRLSQAPALSVLPIPASLCSAHPWGCLGNMDGPPGNQL